MSTELIHFLTLFSHLYHPNQTQTQANKITRGPWIHHLGIITPTQLLLPLKYIYYNHNQIQNKSYPQKENSFQQLFHQNRLKHVLFPTPVSKQLIPTIKQSTLDELPNSDKGNLTTKNKYILNDVQQPRNEIPVEGTNRKKRQLKKYQGTQLRGSVENQFELRSSSQRTTGQEINTFYVNFLYLLSFLQQKLIIAFSSIGFQNVP